MKRSKLNRLLLEAQNTVREYKFNLPPWAFYTPKDWADAGPEADQIRNHELGWIVADFSDPNEESNFEQHGLLLFVARNGLLGADGKLVTPQSYAEKIMIVRPGQRTSYHFHWKKFEDLLNRSGGRLLLEVAWAHENERDLLDDEVALVQDNIVTRVKAKETITLQPGQSVQLPPRLCHQFYGHPGDGHVLAGEISNTNDDHNDNCFLGREFASNPVIEDEPPAVLTIADYAKFWPKLRG